MLESIAQHPWGFVLTGFSIVPMMFITTFIAKIVADWVDVRTEGKGFTLWFLVPMVLFLVFQVINLLTPLLSAYFLGLSTKHVVLSFCIGLAFFMMAFIIMGKRWMRVQRMMLQGIAQDMMEHPKDN